jgi:hypothetical protein
MKALGRIVIAGLFAGLFAILLLACSPRQTNTDPVPLTSAPTAPKPTKLATPPTSKPTVMPPSKVARYCDTKISASHPVLRDVKFGRHEASDRLAFHFCRPVTISYNVVSMLTTDPGGSTVKLKGHSFIEIRIAPATAITSRGKRTWTTAVQTELGRNIQQHKLIGDFEGVLLYGVSVDHLQETSNGGGAFDPQDPRHYTVYFDIGL